MNNISVFYNENRVSCIEKTEKPVSEFNVSFFLQDDKEYNKDLLRIESNNEYYISYEAVNKKYNVNGKLTYTSIYLTLNLIFRLKQ